MPLCYRLRAMRVRLSDTLSPAAASRCIAFLHEAGTLRRALRPVRARADPRARSRLRGFAARTGEIVAEGGWILCGLGRGPAPARPPARDAAAGARRVALRRVAGATSRSCFDDGVSARRLPVAPAADRARATTRFDRYKSRKAARRRRAGQATVVPPPGTKSARLRRRPRGRPRPSPERSAGRATSATRRATTSGPRSSRARRGRWPRGDGFRLRVLDKREIEQEKMGGLLGVNAGSARPPGLPHRRVRARAGAGNGRPRRQGHHVRLGRHLDQARRLDGRDEVRHDGRGDRLRDASRRRGR